MLVLIAYPNPTRPHTVNVYQEQDNYTMRKTATLFNEKLYNKVIAEGTRTPSGDCRLVVEEDYVYL